MSTDLVATLAAVAIVVHASRNHVIVLEAVVALGTVGGSDRVAIVEVESLHRTADRQD